MSAPAIEVFHLQGQHDQKDHGRRAPSDGRDLWAIQGYSHGITAAAAVMTNAEGRWDTEGFDDDQAAIAASLLGDIQSRSVSERKVFSGHGYRPDLEVGGTIDIPLMSVTPQQKLADWYRSGHEGIIDRHPMEAPIMKKILAPYGGTIDGFADAFGQDAADALVSATAARSYDQHRPTTLWEFESSQSIPLRDNERLVSGRYEITGIRDSDTPGSWFRSPDDPTQFVEGRSRIVTLKFVEPLKIEDPSPPEARFAVEVFHLQGEHDQQNHAGDRASTLGDVELDDLDGEFSEASADEIVERFKLDDGGTEYPTVSGGRLYRADDGRYVTLDPDDDGIYVQLHDDLYDVQSQLDITDLETQVEDAWREDAARSTVYHGTRNGETAEAILSDGLQTMNETRGINNRWVGSAVYTTTEPEMARQYGNVFEVDLPRAIADGVVSADDLQREPGFNEADAMSMIASSFEDYDFDPYSQFYGSGEDPQTVVIGAPIPPEYLTYDEDGTQFSIQVFHLQGQHDQATHGNRAGSGTSLDVGTGNRYHGTQGRSYQTNVLKMLNDGPGPPGLDMPDDVRADLIKRVESAETFEELIEATAEAEKYPTTEGTYGLYRAPSSGNVVSVIQGELDTTTDVKPDIPGYRKEAAPLELPEGYTPPTVEEITDLANKLNSADSWKAANRRSNQLDPLDIMETRTRMREAGGAEELIAEMVHAWSSTTDRAGMAEMRRKFAEGDPAAQEVVRIISSSPVAEVPLYRGLAPTSQVWDTFSQLKPGDEIPNWGVSGFSDDPGVAERFAGGGFGEYADGVIITLPAGTTPALRVRALSDVPGEREWLTSNNFRIVSIEEVSGTSIDRDGGETVRTGLRVVVEPTTVASPGDDINLDDLPPGFQ